MHDCNSSVSSLQHASAVEERLKHCLGTSAKHSSAMASLHSRDGRLRDGVAVGVAAAVGVAVGVAVAVAVAVAVEVGVGVGQSVISAGSISDGKSLVKTEASALSSSERI
mmetsp:Transcript_4552/g.13781  ORF Transcript_4552/g.13781 Transcript_4552/m.13781 type:complete len:110 (-) Transcript_4552:864-1193(-)